MFIDLFTFSGPEDQLGAGQIVGILLGCITAVVGIVGAIVVPTICCCIRNKRGQKMCHVIMMISPCTLSPSFPSDY